MSDGQTHREVAQMTKTTSNDDHIWTLLEPYSRWGAGPDLERAARLMGPEIRQLASGVVITGSNGKGTVTYLTAELLRRDGLRVGRYVSPHLWSITERVSIDGTSVSRAELAHALQRVLDESDPSDLQAASQFELLTAAAVRLFHSHAVDTVVWEAGLGGRFDPTRLVPKHAAALTSVALEHTTILGSTPIEIALEKSAIANTYGTTHSVPLVVGPLAPEVIKRLSEQQPLIYPADISVKTALGGAHQIDNARIAASLATLVSNQKRTHVDVSELVIPCRTECVRPRSLDTPAVWVDVAHHQSAIRALVPWLSSLPKPLSIIFGSSQDRDPGGMIAYLPSDATVIISEAPYKPARVEDIITPRTVVPCPQLNEALDYASAITSPQGTIVVLGGLYLAAAAAALLRGQRIDAMRWR